MESETMGARPKRARGPGEERLRAAVHSYAQRRRARAAVPGPVRRGADQGPPGPPAQPRREAAGQPHREVAGRPRREAAGQPRTDDPKPYDNDWGWWIEFRLGRIEAQIKWLVALAAGTLVAEVLRVALAALGLP